MKFGKEFASQMVPEWQEAYMDYNYLKGVLKDILNFKQKNAPLPEVAATPKGSLKRRLSMYKAFSGLQSRYNSFKGSPGKNNHEDEMIVVQQEDSEGHYGTIFLVSFEEGGESELLFFRRLDDEFNKVLNFYQKKVGEVKVESDELSKQMDALIALRIKVDKISIGMQSAQVMDYVTVRSFCKEELRKAEEQMKRAFVEFYQKLRLLKSYRSLNVCAFSKMMKKYDKVLQMIEKSYLGSSDEVLELFARVEATFIKHFVNGNRRKGMKYLRPQGKRETHRVTFVLGLFSGCSIALVAAIAVSIHAGNLLDHEGRGQYMENIFPLYRRFRVNYPFIFGFKQGTKLGYRQVLLLASGISVLLLITFCPLNIIYRSSRFFLIRCVWRCLCAPLYKVSLPDFFLADQFTSQVQAIRSLQFYVCYYVWGNFRTRSNRCQESSVYPILYIFVAIIPFWSRFIQPQIFINHCCSCDDQKRGTFWRVMAASTSGITTVANTCWDIVMDWGLLQRNSKKTLGDKLLVPYKIVYFVAIVLDIILRLVWMQLVLDFQELPFLHQKAFVAIVACLEILLPGMWNFFRLENEHLNNVGKYRASKSVPLPFNYDEDEMKL
ncbi:hypothetical protein K7X08_018626 [Anisodus acutangulus]|uniref:SPX domain-containing protein n=1 Tax=Anisodus acutangulus TaxID=402998 RepID=A0A9Q1R935_9SOLA|nr:hypothetical protein K7X08_018626 [Anisodus acutangulus]